MYIRQRLTELHEGYRADGSKKLLQRLYQNVVHKPIIQSEPEEIILRRLPPSSLHILLGTVDRFLIMLENKFGVDFVNQYLATENIVRKFYQGGHSLEENQSHNFVKKGDKLESFMCRAGEEVAEASQQFIAAIRAFREVMDSLLTVELEPDYEEKMRKFMQLYKELPDANMFVKLHILEIHALEFLNLVNCKGSNPDLRYYCVQPFEVS